VFAYLVQLPSFLHSQLRTISGVERAMLTFAEELDRDHRQHIKAKATENHVQDTL